eukprot:TRINITY_DN4523_c0_g1_i1.p1 TRINITY_DN4523_c0_g1~~TRINITY_DN4523_c0_g1_i1.p1  ORF type:complete len:438 (-),score=99.61 TRINITY_DN4523_c0_g1_i1:407-1720(-)
MESNRSINISITLLAVIFFFVFVCLFPTQNFLSAYSDTLGYWADCGIYVGVVIGCPLASYTVKTIGTKKALLIGCFPYVIFMISNFFLHAFNATYGLMIPSAILLGFGAAIFWTAQGTYCSFAAMHICKNNNTEKTPLGFYNGAILGSAQMANAFGNLLVSFLLHNNVSFDAIFIAFSIVSASSFFVIFKLKVLKEPEMDKLEFENEKTTQSPIQLLTAVGRQVLKSHKMQLMLPVFILAGCVQSFMWGTFTADVIKPSIGKSNIGYIMCICGSFDCIGSFVFGKLSDKIPRRFVLLLGVLMLAPVSIFFSFNTLPTHNWFWLIAVAALLGSTDSILQTQCSALMGHLFPKEMLSSSFANFTLWKSLATAAGFFVGPLIGLHTKAIIVVIALCIACIALAILHWRLGALDDRISRSEQEPLLQNDVEDNSKTTKPQL